MTKYNKVEIAVHNQKHPVRPNTPRVWQVWSSGVLVYQNGSIALCWVYIKKHGLNTKPITKR